MADHPIQPDDDLRLAELLEGWARFRAGDPAFTLAILRAQAGNLWPQLIEIVDMDEALAGLTGTAGGELAGRFGRFEIAERLGSGNFGVVYRARDTEARREVALKVLTPLAALDERVLRRFQEEGRTAVRHPHIVRIHDSGTIEGRAYIAMEVMEGGSLDKLLDRARALQGPPDGRWNVVLDEHGVKAGPRFPQTEGERFARRMAGLFAPLFGALNALKQAEVVNRDIKPQNLLFTRDGRLKLADFGIAHQADRTTLTGTIQSIGTLPYMSPEQAAGKSKQVTVASDVYSLGATLCEALTLRPPLEGGTVGELLGAILATKPPSVSERQTGIPEDLAVLIARCLEKDPADRPQEPEQVEFALQEIAAGRPGRIRQIPWARRMSRFAARHRTGFSLAAGMLVAGVAALWMASSKSARISVGSPLFPAALQWDGADVGLAPYAAEVAPGTYVLRASVVDPPGVFEPIVLPLEMPPGADWERMLVDWKPLEGGAWLDAYKRRLGLELGRLPTGPGSPRGGDEGVKVLSPRGDVGPSGLVLIVDGAAPGTAWSYTVSAADAPGVPLFEGSVPPEALADGWSLPPEWIPRLSAAGVLRIELRRTGDDAKPVAAVFRLLEAPPLTERLKGLPPEARRALHPRLVAALAGLEEGRAVEAYLECRALLREFPPQEVVLDAALEALVRLRLDGSEAYRTLYEQRAP